MEWKKNDVTPEEIRLLAQRYDIDLLTATILARRGITDPEDVLFFLEDDVRFLHSPFLFVEMEEAVDRVNVALDEGQPIFVFGDRDVDGITSTVLLVDALRELGGVVRWGVPMGDNAYGLTLETVEELAREGAALLLTVDCGISNLEEIARASELGVDTVLLDHHHPHSEIPVVSALVNPRMEDCGYPFPHLSACAVAYKFCWALRFSRTAFYGQTVAVMTVVPANEAFTVEVVRLYNLVEDDRLAETLVPGYADPSNSRLIPFLEGCEIVVYDLPAVAKQLQRCFGTEVELPATDLSTIVAETYPVLAGKSLLRIKEQSRIAKYRKSSEADVLANLFVSIVMKREGLLENGLRDLDLVAMSTLADSMPMRDENRVLVKTGLARLQQSERKGLRQLLLKKGLLGKRLDTKSVTWQLSPVLNSTGRMGEPNKAVELLLAEDGRTAEDLVDYINGLNNRRKKVEDRIWDRIQKKAHDSHEKTGGKFVYVVDDIVERGVTGILAARLSRLLRAPALVAARLDDRIVGSLRSPRTVHLKRFLDGFADLLTDYGGHDFAAGFNMPSSHLEEFETRFYQRARAVDSGPQPQETLDIDAEIPGKLLEPSLYEVSARFEPFGESNPPLTFVTRRMKVLSWEAVGKKEAVHLKLLLGSGSRKWPAIWWNAAERAGRDLDVDDEIDVVYRLSRSEWRGHESLQLTVLDARR